MKSKANKITMIRVYMVPVYALLMYLDFKYHFIIAGIIFIIASLSDMLDGYVARKYNEVTDFGKFADPVADKILVLTAVVIFVGIGRVHSWTAVVIIIREMIVFALRNVAALGKKVLAADTFGKLKTITQLIALSMMHFEERIPFIATPATVIYYISVAFTVYSGINYVVKNKEILLS